MATFLNENALTTLKNVKLEMDICTVDDDEYLKKLINRYSNFFEQRTGKSWYKKSGHVENIQSFGDTRLQVSDHLPVESISEVKFYDDDPINSSEYEIEEADVGWIRFKKGVWNNTVVEKQRIEYYDHTYEYKAKITYTGGYVTPNQAAPGGTFSGSDVTLPADIQQGVIQTIVNKYRMRASATNVSGESLGDASISFASPSDMASVGGMSVSHGLADSIKFYKKRRVY